jgi:hypothetical protein
MQVLLPELTNATPAMGSGSVPVFNVRGVPLRPDTGVDVTSPLS